MVKSSPEAWLLQEACEAARLCFGLQDSIISPLKGGRVNESFVLESGGRRFVLQKLNDIFEGNPAMGLNWQAVRQALAGRAADGLELAVPDIVPDLRGDLISTPAPGAAFWRLSRHIPGLPASLDSKAAREAARLLGRLHTCLNTPAPIELLPPPEAELTNQRLTRPEDFEVLPDTYRRHPNLDELAPLIEQGAEAARFLPSFPAFWDVFQLRELLIHGDPKADNFIFAPDGRALALVDWDNVRYGHVLIDVAEMLRSWGRPMEGAPGVCLENMAAVTRGYGETGLALSEQDLALLPTVLRGVCLTLARRYLTDALAGVFFKWDHEQYPSLYMQNKSRARQMLDLAEYLLNHEIQLGEVFQAAYGQGFSREAKEFLPF